MFILFITNYNLRLVKWLNNSYDNKQGTPDWLWVLRPVILLALLSRVFFIILKRVLRIFNGIAENQEENSYTIYLKDIFHTSLLNILLYRKSHPYARRKIYKPTPLLSLGEIKKQELEFILYSQPLVSIVIPVYNKVEYTFNCLVALKENVSSKISYEIIIVDDHSSDATKELIGRVKGINFNRNEENLGFLLSSNKGASVARGEYICFLNNDTEIQVNWLESLVDIFCRYPDAGIAGSMLIYPDNKLQEAGGIIWNDATGMNYGRLMDCLDPKFNFVRPVDYCSGASILIRKRDFEILQGFNKIFAPAYYEDTDLCFDVRNQLGKKVFYQPESRLLHHEGITSGRSTSSGVKRFQVINQEVFRQKWERELQKHYKDQPEKGALRLCGKQTILIVDLYIPAFDKESGSFRMFQLIGIFKELDYHVIFAPDNEAPEEPYTFELQQLGVEVIYRSKDFHRTVIRQIEERLPYIDIAWICRPSLFAKYSSVLKKKNSIKLIYDTIDLHYLRLKREAELFPERKIDWKTMKRLEQKCGKESTMTIAITEVDKQILKEMEIQPVETIPNIHVPNRGVLIPFEERSGILFIGGYNHPPNVDAVIWLCNEIMPLVWQEHPDLKVTLLGNKPTESVRELASSNVTVTGYIQDVSSYFKQSKIFVAPLRYGAGMKGKIGQSLEFSLPIVSTSIGSEGMNLEHEYHCMLANDPKSFAEAIIQLYFDKKRWERISSNAHEAILPYSPEEVKDKLRKIFVGL